MRAVYIKYCVAIKQVPVKVLLFLFLSVAEKSLHGSSCGKENEKKITWNGVGTLRKVKESEYLFSTIPHESQANGDE